MKEINENESHQIFKLVVNKEVFPLIRSNTTPIEDYIDITEGEEDILNTYNYYCYYHAQKPFNPRLKKPKYKPTPDYDFIRSGLPEKSIKNSDEISNASFSKDFKEKSEDLTQIIDSLNLKEKQVSKETLDKENTFPCFTVPSYKSINIFDESPKNNTITQKNIDYQFDYPSQTSVIQNPYPNQLYHNNNYFYNPGPNNINQLLMNQDSYIQNNINLQHKFLQQNHLYISPQPNYPFNYNTMMVNTPIFNSSIGGNMKMGNPPETLLDHMSSFSEILENIAKNCKTYVGSKLIQEIYPNINDKEKNSIIENLLPFVYDLSEDQYGNYVMQKIIEYSHPEQRIMIYKQIEGKIYSLSIDMYGCRVLQKLIELSDYSTVKQILEEIRNDLKECILNKNGNHVILKLIQKLHKREYIDITQVVVENSYEIAISQFGCRVIQRIIEYGTEEDKNLIYQSLIGKFHDLIFDQFGNYVIQHFLEKRGSMFAKEIYSSLEGKVFDMCIHKNAR